MVNMGSLSSVNMEKAERIHNRVGLELERDGIQMNGFSSELPRAEQRQVRTAVENILVDTDMGRFLVQAGIINREGTWLTPVQTIGDGNCLPHAVSLYMWGVQDKKLHLRSCLAGAVLQDRGALRQRWAHQRRARDAAVPGVPIGGVDYAPGQWDGEWDTMVEMASAAPNGNDPNQTRYRPLEEFHIFALANILRRPIIVFADTIARDSEGKSFAPIPFGGIYLPLLHAPEDCIRSPILLGYNNQHFTPLLTTQTLGQNGDSTSANPPHTISLMRQSGERLPVQYILPEEERRDLLTEYLNIIPAEHNSNNNNNTLAAALDIVSLPDRLNLFKDFVKYNWEGTMDQGNILPGLSSYKKPVTIVRPLSPAVPTSRPVPCTETGDGPGASHSPLEESFLTMKLAQGGQTATVVNPDQTSATTSSQTVTPAPPLPIQENTASPLHGENLGGSHQQVASEEGQRSNAVATATSTTTHGVMNDRNQNASNTTSVTAATPPSYAEAVKSLPLPQTQPYTPKPKLLPTPSKKPLFTPKKKPTCKNPDCKGSPSPQNGGYCVKCHRKNSAEKRKERRESLSRTDTPVRIGSAVNKKYKRNGGQATKPKNSQKPQTTSTAALSSVQQEGEPQHSGRATGGQSDRTTHHSTPPTQHQSSSPETTPGKLEAATNSAIPSTMQTNRKYPVTAANTNVHAQTQVPGSVQYPNNNGTCQTAGCAGLGLPHAEGFCVDCWVRRQDETTTKVQQGQAASNQGQVSAEVANIYKAPGRNSTSRNGGTNTGVSPPLRCRGPKCGELVDEGIDATLCPECYSLLERRNSNSHQSQTANGGVSDSSRSRHPSMRTRSHDQPAGRSRYFTQEPDVRRCLRKGCNRDVTRENSFYCRYHGHEGNAQQGRHQSGPQSSHTNSSQQNGSSNHVPSITSAGPMTLNINTVEHLHVHNYPSPDSPHSNGTDGFDARSQSDFFTAPGTRQSNLRARGSGSPSRPPNGFSGTSHSGAATGAGHTPVSEYGPVCPKCQGPGIAWFDDLCQKCHKQQKGLR